MSSNALRPLIFNPEHAHLAANHPVTPLVEGADEALVFKNVLKLKLQLHCFYAKDAEGERIITPSPAILFIFGGGWSKYYPTHFQRQAAYFSKLGLNCFLVEYRSMKHFELDPDHPDAPPFNEMFSVFKCISDARSAMRYLRSNADSLHLDPDRILAAGGSAGGHLCLCCHPAIIGEEGDDPGDDITINPAPNAFALFNPVCDTTQVGYGFDPEHPEISLAYHPTRGPQPEPDTMPPLLVQHGTTDTTTPIQNARDLIQFWNTQATACELIEYEGRNHGFFNNGEDYNSTVANMEAFIKTLGWL